jgi:hypothetical protein
MRLSNLPEREPVSICKEALDADGAIRIFDERRCGKGKGCRRKRYGKRQINYNGPLRYNPKRSKVRRTRPGFFSSSW